MSAAHRPKGRNIREVKVPTREGVWKNRTTKTRDRVLARRMQRMVNDLGPWGRQAWDVLERVTQTEQEGRLTLPELWVRWMATPGRFDVEGNPVEPSIDERIAHVRASFRVANLVTLAKKWHQVLLRPGAGVSTDTADHYYAAVHNYLAWSLELEKWDKKTVTEVALARLTALTLRDWVEEMDDVAQGTVRKRGMGMRRFTAWLCAKGHLPIDPMLGVDLPAAGDPRTHHIDTPLAKLLADAQPGAYRRFATLLPGSGIEVSVALALRARHVIKATREIRARGTKTHNRDRIVRVAEWAWPAVQAALEGKHPDALLFEEIPNRWLAGDAHRDAVAALAGAHPILLEERGYTMRDHRHTWAVRAVRSGWPIEAVGKQLGHKDGVLALRVYGRFQPTHQERERWEQMATERDRQLEAEGGR